MSNKTEYRPMTIPKVQWDKKTLTETYGELVAQPLEPGFGVTFGNALRRILLGAIEGSAVTSVIIKGANNEFASLPGIAEDVMQILLNIKGIIISNETGESGKMTLSFNGGVAKASDIKADKHLTIVNPDHVLATVTPEDELEIEFFVESGRGYQAAQWPLGKGTQEDGRIYLDAMFSPVTKIFFDVEKTMVGNNLDHDKVTLRIHTNGSERPTDVMHYGVSVMRTQLEHFLISPEIPFNEISESLAEEEAEGVSAEDVQDLGLDDIPIDVLLKSIDELELSARSHNCLVSAGKKRILDLVNLSREEALNLKNFGNKSLREVEESLKSFGLSFGSNINEEDIKKVLKTK